MKFGKNLVYNQVPEWTNYYVDYKNLKRHLNMLVTVIRAAPNGEEQATQQKLFREKLESNALRVEDFFVQKNGELERRFCRIAKQYPQEQPAKFWGTDVDEIKDLIGEVLELRTKYRKLYWFAEINSRGFRKILKKIEKKVGLCMDLSGFRFILSEMNFARTEVLVHRIAQANEYLNMAIEHEKQAKTNGGLTGTSSDFTRAISENDTHMLQKLLQERNISHKEILFLLHQALMSNSDNCLAVLLENCSSLADPSDSNGRNILHKWVIHLGYKYSPPNLLIDKIPRSSRIISEYVVPEDKVAKETETLEHLLQMLPVKDRSALISRDQQLRTPLHYVAQYGFSDVAKLMCDVLAQWNLIDKAPSWADIEGKTPLDISTENNYPITTSVLLQLFPPKHWHLQTAASMGSASLIAALLNAKCGVDYQNSRGETALFIATKRNYIDCMKLLIEYGSDTELAEYTFGWTPLFAAAIGNFIDAIHLLIRAGAKFDGSDFMGWTATEHAALRGNIALAELLPSPPSPQISRVSSAAASSLGEQDTEIGDPEVVKSFGHPYCRSESLILVTLGSQYSHVAHGIVQFADIPYEKAVSFELDSALSLRVSADGASGENFTVDLPVEDDSLATEPVRFTTETPDKTQVYFDLLLKYSSDRQLLGRAAINVGQVTKTMGDLRSLNDVLTAPILEAKSLEIIGTVTFNVLVVHPFDHPNIDFEKSSTYWRSLITTRVIGHRGLGKNTQSYSSLQLGENTVESFIQAANLGASYVEFDVQLTKDKIPVIYHDFVVSQSGFDIPMHDITLQQLVNNCRPQPSNYTSPMTTPSPSADKPEYYKPQFKRSLSSSSVSRENLHERMKLTRDFQTKGYKGNLRGYTIQSNFATLVELFKTLPESLGFNIECKYPMLNEAEEELLDPLAMDMNKWVDAVLEVVYTHKGKRDIIFSSFHPDICILLSLKQPSLPVLFLTESGTTPMVDIRASSLQEAIRFAKKWNLLGIVSEATPLIKCPRLARVVKNSGLVLVTYGVSNNDTDNVRKQLSAGVDAVIVDSVLAIRKNLHAQADEDRYETVLDEEISQGLDAFDKTTTGQEIYRQFSFRN